MQTNDLWSGYSDLLIQFKIRTRTKTDLGDLRVMFFLEEDFNNVKVFDLVASENDGEHVMSLAIFNKKRGYWQEQLLPGTDAWLMVRYFCENYDPEEISEQMNDAFDTYI